MYPATHKTLLGQRLGDLFAHGVFMFLLNQKTTKTARTFTRDGTDSVRSIEFLTVRVFDRQSFRFVEILSPSTAVPVSTSSAFAPSFVFFARIQNTSAAPPPRVVQVRFRPDGLHCERSVGVQRPRDSVRVVGQRWGKKHAPESYGDVR